MKAASFVLSAAAVLLAVFACCGCRQQKEGSGAGAENGGGEGYLKLTAAEAKAVMDSGAECTVIDAREQNEFDEGHIPNAVLMPYTRVEELAPALLPDKTGCILVYCRSGRRSKIAAETLVKMGYTDVREFGGITDWPYETVK